MFKFIFHMEKKIDFNTELARWYDQKGELKTITIKNYLKLVDEKDQETIADFILNRLHSRYLKPFLFEEDPKFKKYYKNGFSIMANSCLLIETLQSFKNGWGDSDRKSELAFKQFFTTQSDFSIFKDYVKLFYKNIRCGILHQGETTGGWKINRSGTNLFDKQKMEVDSITFAKKLYVSLDKYSQELKDAKWDSELWDNFRTKMRKIISNCERLQ